MDDNIKGKVVVITGASSGMGEAAAKHLSKLGAMVVLGARRTDRIEKLAKEIQESGELMKLSSVQPLRSFNLKK